MNNLSLNDAPFPWQQKQWEHVMQLIHSNKRPHALLITGTEGLGKHFFALAIARSVLCPRFNYPQGACRQCEDCHLSAINHHPDLICLSPEESGKAIKVDAVRHLIQITQKTPQRGIAQVVCIYPAEAMNTASANALLKCLEEPSGNTLLLLVSHYPARLPATIRSRCQKLRLQNPSQNNNTTIKWLQARLEDHHDIQAALAITDHAPLRTLDLINADEIQQTQQFIADLIAIIVNQQNPVITAQKWNKTNFLQLMLWFEGMLLDMLRLKMMAETQWCYTAEQKAALQQCCALIEEKHLFVIYDLLIQTLRDFAQVSALNNELMLENLLITWQMK